MCPGKRCNYTDLIVLLLSFSVLLKQQVCVFSLMLGSDGTKKKRKPLETSSEISGGWDTSPFLPLLLSYFLVNFFVVTVINSLLSLEPGQSKIFFGGQSSPVRQRYPCRGAQSQRQKDSPVLSVTSVNNALEGFQIGSNYRIIVWWLLR